MIKWLDNHLVKGWRGSWQWFSIQTAAVAAAVGGVVTASPELLLQLVMFLPEGGWLRTVLIAAVVLTMFVVPAIARLWDQEDRDDAAEG